MDVRDHALQSKRGVLMCFITAWSHKSEARSACEVCKALHSFLANLGSLHILAAWYCVQKTDPFDNFCIVGLWYKGVHNMELVQKQLRKHLFALVRCVLEAWWLDWREVFEFTPTDLTSEKHISATQRAGHRWVLASCIKLNQSYRACQLGLAIGSGRLILLVVAGWVEMNFI